MESWRRERGRGERESGWLVCKGEGLCAGGADRREKNWTGGWKDGLGMTDVRTGGTDRMREEMESYMVKKKN